MTNLHNQLQTRSGLLSMFLLPMFLYYLSSHTWPILPPQGLFWPSTSRQVFVTALINSSCHHLLPSMTQCIVKLKSLSQIPPLSNHFPTHTANRIIFPKLILEAHCPPQSHRGYPFPADFYRWLLMQISSPLLPYDLA